ncbi:hypothetical protein BC827DRAFT_1208930 [Russula dissimulans]|nr:hypothetical protein BC827DRAFT_1208930 [Russula dissimulans]
MVFFFFHFILPLSRPLDVFLTRLKTDHPLALKTCPSPRSLSYSSLGRHQVVAMLDLAVPHFHRSIPSWTSRSYLIFVDYRFRMLISFFSYLAFPTLQYCTPPPRRFQQPAATCSTPTSGDIQYSIRKTNRTNASSHCRTATACSITCDF